MEAVERPAGPDPVDRGIRQRPNSSAGAAQWCGHSLARSHARSSDPALISGYLGESDTFDKAIADFRAAYADQTERDHAALKKAARNGRLKVLMEKA